MRVATSACQLLLLTPETRALKNPYISGDVESTVAADTAESVRARCLTAGETPVAPSTFSGGGAPGQANTQLLGKPKTRFYKS